MTTLQKYPEEIRDYAFNFSAQKEIAAGGTLSGTPVVTSELLQGAGTITFGTPNIVGNTVEFTITGGTSGDIHEVRCTIGTALGETLAAAGLLEIRRV